MSGCRYASCGRGSEGGLMRFGAALERITPIYDCTFNSRPVTSKLGRFRLATKSFCSSRAEIRMGIAMVESEWHVTMEASLAILPQLWASSNVQPERPPQCVESVTHWVADF